MNNTTTRTLAIFAVFMAVTLVVGTLAATTIATTQSTAFAYSPKKDNKKDDGRNGNDNGNTVTIQKCKQAATQSGFDNNQGQECENLICTHPGENATCVQEGLAAAAVQQGNQTTPVKLTCEECITKFLTPLQLMALKFRTPAEACTFLHQFGFDEGLFRTVLTSAGVSVTILNELIACLKGAGIVFT